MINFEENKPFIIGAGVLVGVGAIFFLTKGNNKNEFSIQGQSEPTFGNETLFIPTNSYDVQIVAGDQSIVNTDNRNYQENKADNGGVINNPIQTPKPAEPTKPQTKKLTLTAETSIYTSKTAKADGSLAPQTVEVVADSGDGWVQINTWKGLRWIKPNTKEAVQTATSPQNKVIDYTIQKGDTLWSISQKLTGNPRNYVQIAKENGIANPDKIFYGNHLKITIPNSK
jgi:LysM repeat protein